MINSMSPIYNIPLYIIIIAAFNFLFCTTLAYLLLIGLCFKIMLIICDKFIRPADYLNIVI